MTILSRAPLMTGFAERMAASAMSTAATLADRPESPEHDAALQARPAFASQCLFCEHANPVGAKFCNDCAGPLHLKLCKQCDAINDLPATNCYKCGAGFPSQLLPLAEALSTAQTAGSALASLAFGDGDIERGHTPLPQRASEARNLLQRPQGDDLAATRAHDMEAIVREARRLIRGVSPFFFVHKRAAHVFSVRHFMATVQRSRVARVALPAFLVAALALSGRYLYGHLQSDLGGRSSAIRAPSSAVLAKTEVPVAVGGGTVGMSTEATSQSAPVIAPTSDTAGSQVTWGKIRTIESQSVNAEELKPSQAPATAASQSFDTVGAGPRPVTPIANESRQNAMHASASQRVLPKQIPSNRSTPIYPRPIPDIRREATDTAVPVAPDASRVRGCIEAVAALGLCNLDTSGADK